jgi:uncharacterized membrane protein
MAYVVIGWTVLPAKSWRSANVVMIIGALTFQIGLASRSRPQAGAAPTLGRTSAAANAAATARQATPGGGHSGAVT